MSRCRRMSGRRRRGLYRSSGNEWIPDPVGDDIRTGGRAFLTNFAGRGRGLRSEAGAGPGPGDGPGVGPGAGPGDGPASGAGSMGVVGPKGPCPVFADWRLRLSVGWRDRSLLKLWKRMDPRSSRG
jgi:hypothetical protein